MQLTFMTVKIERVEKVNDKHASCPNSSAQHTDQGQILLLQDKTNVNLILPAEAASMPNSKWVLFMGGLLTGWLLGTQTLLCTTAPLGRTPRWIQRTATQPPQLLSIKICTKFSSLVHI